MITEASLSACILGEPRGTRSLFALDGGGIRGLLSLQILKRIEALARECSGNPYLMLCECFDFIAGTSTGDRKPAREGQRKLDRKAFVAQLRRISDAPKMVTRSPSSGW